MGYLGQPCRVVDLADLSRFAERPLDQRRLGDDEPNPLASPPPS